LKNIWQKEKERKEKKLEEKKRKGDNLMKKKKNFPFPNLISIVFISLFLISFISAEVNLGETPEDIIGIILDFGAEPITTTIITNNYSINGTEVVHNNLTGLQGGDDTGDGEFYHLTQTLYDLVVANAVDWITSRWSTSSSEYLYNDTDSIYFNDTLLNETIDDRAAGVGAAGIWTNDTYPGLAEFDGNISIKNQIQFTDSNITVIVNETEFAIYL